VALCPGCGRAWEPSGGKLAQVVFGIKEADYEPEAFLPFWRLSLRLPEFEIRRYSDFVRLIRLPLVPKKEWERMVMTFWIPGFKIRPKIFQRVAKRMTLSQHLLEYGGGRVYSGMYPVTLPAPEAWQAVKIVLASCMERRRTCCLAWEVQIEAIRTTLVYVPLSVTVTELIQPETTLGNKPWCLGDMGVHSDQGGFHAMILHWVEPGPWEERAFGPGRGGKFPRRGAGIPKRGGEKPRGKRENPGGEKVGPPRNSRRGKNFRGRPKGRAPQS